MQQPCRLDVNYAGRKQSEALRMVFYHLKAKFDAVDWGLYSFEEEFLPYFMGKLPDGRQATVAELMLPGLEKGRLPEYNPFKALQLTEGGQ